MQRILSRMLLVALPAAFGCSGSVGSQQIPTSGLFPQGNGDCSAHDVKVRVSVDEEKAPPPLQLRIESCRIDSDACMDMCTYELANLPSVVDIFGATYEPAPEFDNGEGGGGGVGFDPPTPVDTSGITPSACKVTFDGGTASADIGFQTFDNGGGCPEPDSNGTAEGSSSTTPTPVGGP